MGRFARSQDAIATPTSLARGKARPDFSSRPEKAKSRMVKPGRQRARRIRYFWIAIVSIIGLCSGWILGQVSISPKQEAVAIEPALQAEDSGKSKQSPEANAIPAATPAQDAQFIEQQPQASTDYYRKPNKARRNIAVPRARMQNGRAQNGAVTMMLKPFKAINPLKLRRLRPW